MNLGEKNVAVFHPENILLEQCHLSSAATSNKTMFVSRKIKTIQQKKLIRRHTLPNFKPPKKTSIFNKKPPNLPKNWFSSTTSCRSWVKKSNGSFQSSAPSQALNTALRLEAQVLGRPGESFGRSPHPLKTKHRHVHPLKNGWLFEVRKLLFSG